jgi:hypothetical protein
MLRAPSSPYMPDVRLARPGEYSPALLVLIGFNFLHQCVSSRFSSKTGADLLFSTFAVI